MTIARLLSSLATLALAGLILSGCSWFGGKDKPENPRLESRTYALGVNGYLWRGALDTIGFMPMAQADGANGVILTEWYVNPDVPTERLKVSVFILDRALRADAITVNVYREVLDSGEWVSAPVRAGTAEQIENAILNRARELRIAAVGQRG